VNVKLVIARLAVAVGPEKDVVSEGWLPGDWGNNMPMAFLERKNQRYLSKISMFADSITNKYAS
jgi:hypothetical protein